MVVPPCIRIGSLVNRRPESAAIALASEAACGRWGSAEPGAATWLAGEMVGGQLLSIGR